MSQLKQHHVMLFFECYILAGVHVQRCEPLVQHYLNEIRCYRKNQQSFSQSERGNLSDTKEMVTVDF